MCPFTQPGQKYADVSTRFLAIQASTIKWCIFPAANIDVSFHQIRQPHGKYQNKTCCFPFWLWIDGIQFSSINDCCYLQSVTCILQCIQTGTTPDGSVPHHGLAYLTTDFTLFSPSNSLIDNVMCRFNCHMLANMLEKGFKDFPFGLYIASISMEET